MSLVRRLLLLSLGLLPVASQAWVYPEHRDIAVLGAEKLDPERRAVLDRLGRRRAPVTRAGYARHLPTARRR